MFEQMNCDAFKHLIEYNNNEKIDLYLVFKPTREEYSFIFTDGSSLYTDVIKGRYSIKRNGIEEEMCTTKIISWKELAKGFEGIDENNYNEIIRNCKKIGEPINFSNKKIKKQIHHTFERD